MAEDAGNIEFKVTADTQNAIRNMDKVIGETKKVDSEFKKTDKTVNKLNTSFKGLASAIAGALAVNQIQSYITTTAQALDTQAKFADRIGASYEELQKLQFAASQTGVQINNLNTGLQRMSRRLETVAQGGAPEVAKQLKLMGIAIEDIAGLKPEEQIRLIADGMQDLATDAQRTTAAFALFDTEGVALVNTLKNGSQALDDYGNQLESIGGIISRDTAAAAEAFNDQLDIMGRAAAGVGATILSEMLPSMQQLNSVIVEFVSDGENVKNIIEGIGVAAQATAIIIAGRFVGALTASVAGMLASATAAGTLSAALAGLRTALTVLGGPAGLLFIAAGAIATFSDNSTRASESLKALDDKTKEYIDTIRTLNAEQAKDLAINVEKKRLDLIERISRAEESLAEARERSNKAGSTGSGFGGIGAAVDFGSAQSDLDLLKKELESLDTVSTAVEERIKSLSNTIGGDGGGGSGSLAGNTERYEQTIKDLNTQYRLLVLQTTGATDAFNELNDATQAEKLLGGEGTKEQLENVRSLLKSIREEQELLNEQSEADSFIEGIIGRDESPSDRLAAELERTKELYREGLISKEQYELALTQIEKEQHAARKRSQQDLLMASSNFFGESAELVKTFAGESSSAYKALFAVSKGFAIANAAIQLQTAIANAFALPWPANLAAVGQAVSFGGQIASNIASINYEGRQSGGAFAAGITQIGEGNGPEVVSTKQGMFMASGDSGRVFNQGQLNQISGGGGMMFNVVVENEPGVVVTGITQEQENLIIRSAVNTTERNLQGQIQNGNGKIGTSLANRYGNGSGRGVPT